jgi:hypothetical protein
MRKEELKKRIEGYYGHLILLSTLHNQEKPFCQSFSENGSSSTRKAAPPEEPELEPFWEEPEPCQTGP